MEENTGDSLVVENAKVQPDTAAVTTSSTLSQGREEENTDDADREKLYFNINGRFLDISHYTEQTPLYPMCRAWVKNQPLNSALSNYNNRSSSPVIKRDVDGEDLFIKISSNEILEVHDLPHPLYTNLSKIPLPLSPTFNGCTDYIDQAMRPDETNWFKNASAQDLLDYHSFHWKVVREEYVKHTKEYSQERFKYSHLIIKHLYQKYAT